MSKKDAFSLVGLLIVVGGINLATVLRVSALVGRHQEQVVRNSADLSEICPQVHALNGQLQSINATLIQIDKRTERIENRQDRLTP